MPLSAKQQLFVKEYLIDLNASAAYRRAGYKAKDADVAGPRLLGNVGIQTAIQEAIAERSQRTEIKADRVLLELSRLAFLDIRGFYRADGTLKLPSELNDDQAAALSSLEVYEEFGGFGEDRTKIGEVRKIKFWDKMNALRTVAQHLGMLVEKHEHTGKDGGPMQIEVLTNEQRAERVRDSARRVLDRRATATPSLN